MEPASSVEAVLGHVGTLALEDTAASTTDTTPGSVDHRPLLLALVYGLWSMSSLSEEKGSVPVYTTPTIPPNFGTEREDIPFPIDKLLCESNFQSEW